MRSLNATHTHTHACTHSHFACMDWVSFIFFVSTLLSFFFIPSTELFPHPHLRARLARVSLAVGSMLDEYFANKYDFISTARRALWSMSGCLSDFGFRNDCAYILTSSIRQTVASMESREISTKLDYFKQISCFSTHTSQGFRTNAGHFVSSEKSEKKWQ